MIKDNKCRQIWLSLSVFWQCFVLSSGICFVTPDVALNQELVIAFSMGINTPTYFL
jgi:hypothetical protein